MKSTSTNETKFVIIIDIPATHTILQILYKKINKKKKHFSSQNLKREEPNIKVLN